MRERPFPDSRKPLALRVVNREGGWGSGSNAAAAAAAGRAAKSYGQLQAAHPAAPAEQTLRGGQQHDAQLLTFASPGPQGSPGTSDPTLHSEQLSITSFQLKGTTRHP